MSLKRKRPDGGENEDIVAALGELAQWEANTNRNAHKANAYRKAAAAIGALDHRLKSGDEAKKLPGVGEKIAKKVDEILATGGLEKLHKIRKDEGSAAINLLSRVFGIGPAKAWELVQMGIKDLDDLRERQELLSPAQKIGLDHFNDFEARIPRSEIRQIFSKIETAIRPLEDGFRAVVCGSYRRGAASSGDIDVLLTYHQQRDLSGEIQDSSFSAPSLHTVVSALESCGLITHSLSQGSTKFMGVCRLGSGLPFRRLDIRLLPPHQFYCGLLYFTGSDMFNKEMRTWALQKGFTLNEYSLRPMLGMLPQEPLPVSSEQDIFDYLDYPYRKPRERI